MKIVPRTLLGICAIVGCTTGASAQWTTSGSNIYNSNAGSVGVGTTSPNVNYKLHVASALAYSTYSANSSNGGVGLFAYATHATQGFSIIGEVTSAAGIGLWGRATTTGSGVTYGVYGQSAGPNSMGVFGTNSSTTGSTFGVRGEVYSPTGYAVSAIAQANSGVNFGVYSATNSSTGYALYALGGRNYFQGNLGVGTDKPAAKLHVDGTARFVNLGSPTANTTGALGVDSSGNVAARSFGAGNGVQEFLSTQSFTFPAGVTKAKVRAWGGGAGGTTGGGGGGSGAYVEAYVTVNSSTTYTVTVGAGGAVNSHGGVSSLSDGGTTIVAAGGGYAYVYCPFPPCAGTSYGGGGTTVNASYVSSATGTIRANGLSSSATFTDALLPPPYPGRTVGMLATSVPLSVGTGGQTTSGGTAEPGYQGLVIIEW